jgi:hypothetical protein
MARSSPVLLVLMVGLLLPSLAAAQHLVISPQAIVVNPLPGFAVDVWVDRDPSGSSVPAYRVGEPIRVGVRVSDDAYVYLFSVGAAGEIVQILPNRLDAAGRDTFLPAGASRTFPPPDARYAFAVEPPSGLAKVIAVASRRPLDTSTLAAFASERDLLASSQLGEDGFARALSIVVQPLPQASWVTATALYHVGSPPAQGAYGTIAAASQPAGAEVYVDGAFAGFTPLRYGTRPGRHEVEVRLAGYAVARESALVRPNLTTELNVVLRPVPAAVRPSVAPLNAYLGLDPCAGFEVTRVRDGRRGSTATFTSPEGLRDVYACLHDQLVQAGWRRTDLDRDDDEIEAEYRRGSESFELELESKGRGRFELEIDFD